MHVGGEAGLILDVGDEERLRALVELDGLAPFLVRVHRAVDELESDRASGTGRPKREDGRRPVGARVGHDLPVLRWKDLVQDARLGEDRGVRYGPARGEEDAGDEQGAEEVLGGLHQLLRLITFRKSKTSR